MQKIIDGVLYDTETSRKLCDVSAPYVSTRDMAWEETWLYRAPKGQFFIAGKGGAASRWAQTVEPGKTGFGSGLRPIDEQNAREMVERHGTVELYSEVFGAPAEA